MNKVVVPLKDAKDVSLVGGKASALGKLISGGFNVPDGFVVNTVSAMKMTKALESEILRSFDNLGAETVAVRSSAVSEDSKKAAWAGQFDTFLNIDSDHLIENIKKCWASAGSARAKSYANEKGLSSGAVAVIVQKMVPSEQAGVAFSVHPVSQDKSQIVIEAVRGLGEKLVSGTTTPDTYVVSRRNNKMTESNLSGKKQILKEKEIADIANQVSKIEKDFGFPVDVEWSIADDQIYILQSRPITTLK